MKEQRRYPLEALLEQRRQLQKEAQKMLARAVERTVSCVEQVRLAGDELKRWRKKMTATREKRSVYFGRPRAYELSMLTACEQRIDEQIAQAQQTLETKKRKLAAAEKEQDEAREVLENAHRNLEVVRKHHGRWKEEKKRAREKVQEEAAAEIVESRMGRHT